MGRPTSQHHIHEAELLRALTNLLNHLKATKRLTYKRITTSGIPVVVGGKFNRFRKNPASGLADLLIFLNCEPPVTIQMELKSTTGELSDSQAEWRLELEKVGHGHLHFTVRTMEAAEEILKKFISW